MTIEQLGDEGILPKDQKFLDMLRHCESPDRCLAICNPLKRKMPYVCDNAVTVFGHDAYVFMQGGFDKLEAVTTPETMPIVMQSMVEFLSRSKVPGFDPEAVIIQEFPFDVTRSDGKLIHLVSTVLGLTYASNADAEFVICLVTENLPQQAASSRVLLTDLKKEHNRIHKHNPVLFKNEVLVKFNMFRPDTHDLTEREKEVLKLLANGNTSAQIASSLSITENTVETHRKNLLEKFDAKNIAELVKKASKLYWLE